MFWRGGRSSSSRSSSRALSGRIVEWSITIEYQSRQEHSNEFQLAADDRFGAEVEAAIRDIVARKRDPKQVFAEVRTMRALIAKGTLPYEIAGELTGPLVRIPYSLSGDVKLNVSR